MFIDQVTNADALPTLERVVEFAGARHRLIAHNIANLSTPNFQPVDVPVGEFQAQLGRAIDERRERFGGHRGELRLGDSRHVKARPGGGLRLEPRAAGPNVLFHDRNNRDLERTMQELAENVGVFRVASELHKRGVEQINTAISLRV